LSWIWLVRFVHMAAWQRLKVDDAAGRRTKPTRPWAEAELPCALAWQWRYDEAGSATAPSNRLVADVSGVGVSEYDSLRPDTTEHGCVG